MAPTPNTDNINDDDWRDDETFLALPVDLLSFKVKPEACNANIEWVSASEESFDYYQIERSIDGINFETVTRVYGEGGSTYRSYKYLDYESEGNSYYRLKMVDLDGTFEYTDVLLLINDCIQQESDNKFIAPYPWKRPISCDRIFCVILVAFLYSTKTTSSALLHFP